jgi:hypothetical protein
MDDGWAALRSGDASTARRAFEHVLADVQSAEAQEGLGQALYLECDYTASVDHYERAYAAYRKDGDTLGAARAARMLAWVCGNVLGDWAVQSGWLARARTILEEAGESRPEYGDSMKRRNVVAAFCRAHYGRHSDGGRTLARSRDSARPSRPALRPRHVRTACRGDHPAGRPTGPARPP